MDVSEATPGVEVVTFGCRLNASESEDIAAQARAEGLSDLVVFNTCAVTREAVRQARQAIRHVKRLRPGARLAATGCAVQIDPQAFAAMPELDLVIGNRTKTSPGALGAEGPRVRVSDIFAAEETMAARPRPTAQAAAHSLRKRARAYVQIQNGCDHRCTFCIIPFGRGESRSIPADDVSARVRNLAQHGIAEVVLTGVDLTSWGADLEGAPSLGALVRQILTTAPELKRLRLSSLDAAEMDAELLDVIADEPRLMPHLHLSIQAGDDLILKRMKRRHRRAQILDLVSSVRARRPEMAIGADLIVGFPTENDEAFRRTCDLVEEAGLSFLHVFPFSARPGTPAARMPQLPPPLIAQRAAALRRAGAAALRRRLEFRCGTRARALVEAPGRARDEDYIEVKFTGEAPVGSIITGPITGLTETHVQLGRWRLLEDDSLAPLPIPGALV